MPAHGQADQHGEAHDVGDGQGDHGLVAVERGPATARRWRPGPTSARWVSAAPLGLPVVPDV